MLNLVRWSVFILNIVMLSVVKLNDVLANVMAPFFAGTKNLANKPINGERFFHI